jgi:hypothetical protein
VAAVVVELDEVAEEEDQEITRNPVMITRLRLRRLCSLRSGIGGARW